MIQKRTLAGRSVSAVGLGCMSFGGIFGATTHADSMACLDKAHDLGIDHLDVAEIYGDGVCEQVIGDWLKQTKADVSIATKAGIYMGERPPYKNDEASLRGSLEGSLRRLGRDHVELFYIHRRAPEIPIEDVMETLVKFINEGKIGAIGFSEIAPYSLRRAVAVHPVAAVQNEYSLWTRQAELGMIQACAELGTTFVAFSPIARGMLGNIPMTLADMPEQDYFRPGNPRFQEPNFSLNVEAINPFRAFCAARGWHTPAAALAWVLDQGDHILPIPGTRTAANLQQLAQADDIAFTDADRAEIARLLPVGFAYGARYNAQQNKPVEHYC